MLQKPYTKPDTGQSELLLCFRGEKRRPFDQNIATIRRHNTLSSLEAPSDPRGLFGQM